MLPTYKCDKYCTGFKVIDGGSMQLGLLKYFMRSEELLSLSNQKKGCSLLVWLITSGNGKII